MDKRHTHILELFSLSLTFTALGILVFIAQLLIHIALHLLPLRAPRNLRSLHAARRQPQKVVRLKLVDLVEEHVEPNTSRISKPNSTNPSHRVGYSRVLLRLHVEDARVNLLILKRLDPLIILPKVNRLLAKRLRRLAIIVEEHR